MVGREHQGPPRYLARSISGNKGDSVYFSVTVYNEPSPGAWSDRIVAIVRDDDLDVDAEGNFSFELGHSVIPNSDGSVTVVVSRGTTEHPNSVTTMDYPRGNLAFRWFLADQVPARPEVLLVKVADAPTSVT